MFGQDGGNIGSMEKFEWVREGGRNLSEYIASEVSARLLIIGGGKVSLRGEF